MKRLLLVLAVAIGVWGPVPSQAQSRKTDARPEAQSPAAPLIRNHALWRDTKGNLIDCHEGGILRVGARYYWYGRAYRGNDKGLYGTGGAKFRCGINCYSSANLVDWTWEGAILSYPDTGWIIEGTWHRPRVLFNKKTSKYVLWFFCLGIPNGKPWVKNVVAVSDKPAGPFTIVGERKLPIDPSGDLALLQDEDGRATSPTATGSATASSLASPMISRTPPGIPPSPSRPAMSADMKASPWPATRANTSSPPPAWRAWTPPTPPTPSPMHPWAPTR